MTTHCGAGILPAPQKIDFLPDRLIESDDIHRSGYQTIEKISDEILHDSGKLDQGIERHLENQPKEIRIANYTEYGQSDDRHRCIEKESGSIHKPTTLPFESDSMSCKLS